MESDSRPSSDKSLQLALESNYWAATRTLLALVRTGAAIAGGGALVSELLIKGWPRWVVWVLSTAFVLLGYWLIWAALKKGREMRDRLEVHLAERLFLFPQREVTIVTVVLQVLIAAVMVLYLLGR